MPTKPRATTIARAGRTEPVAQAVLIALEKAPRQIAAIARGRSRPELDRKPSPSAWSAQEIVAHLRACAEVWGRSIERMLAEDHPVIRYVSPRTWIRKTDYLQDDFHGALRALTASRRARVGRLRRLNRTEWSRRGTFTGTTLGRDATVLGYAARLADHEARHLDQLRRTLGGGGVGRSARSGNQAADLGG